MAKAFGFKISINKLAATSEVCHISFLFSPETIKKLSIVCPLLSVDCVKVKLIKQY